MPLPHAGCSSSSLVVATEVFVRRGVKGGDSCCRHSALGKSVVYPGQNSDFATVNNRTIAETPK